MWGFRFWGDTQVGLVGARLMEFIGKVLRQESFYLSCIVLYA